MMVAHMNDLFAVERSTLIQSNDYDYRQPVAASRLPTGT